MGEVKERGILFSAPMVLALLEGRKTQTRRVLQARHLSGTGFHQPTHASSATLTKCIGQYCPYGRVGDRLWVRETWALEDCGDDGLRVVWAADRAAAWVEAPKTTGEVYYLPSDHDPRPFKPSIHMPRWASRITLEVAEVRVQRLQEISEEDAEAEGVSAHVHESWSAYDPATEGYPSFMTEPDAEMIASRQFENVRHHGPKIISTARDQYRLLWDSINGDGAWEKNPWCWAVSFKVLSVASTGTGG